jgi:isoleucyl-tRNA synthetase
MKRTAQLKLVAIPSGYWSDSFVTTEDGTGIVHTAPAFGAMTIKLAKNMVLAD